jgi:C1A family cysteine protease
LQVAVQLAGAQWQAGVTSLSQLSEMEKRMRLGYEPAGHELSLEQREQSSRINLEVFKSSAVKGEAYGYPNAYDLRTGGFVTPIQNQGSCGSCVSFGAVATVESTLRVIRNNPSLAIDLSEAQLFYCYARAQGRTCGNGWWMAPAMDSFKSGVADEACYPYTAADQNCSNLCSDWQNRAVKISGWHEITAAADMKTWLSTRGSLAACFTVYNDFFSYSGGVYRHVSGAVAGGHCVSVVGYNDVEGYWICKNSWGTGWGESGFFKIAYGECGLDATMWAVDGIVETGWLNSVKILGLWTNDADRNAYVYVSGGIGWRRIAFDTDNVFFNMLVQLATAKAGDRLTNLYQEDGVIKQIYVF